MNELVTTESYSRAVALHKSIIANALSAQQSIYDMGMGFKEMHDEKLYEELGYQTFEEYCEQETGFTRKTVYQYISICENLSADFVTSGLQSVKKLYLISRLSEPEREEIVQNVSDDTTVKELEAQIKKLKTKAARTDVLEHRLEDMNHCCDMVSAQRDKAEKRVQELENLIRDIEQKPVDVAVEDNSAEIEELEQKHNAEKRALQNELEKLREELKNQPKPEPQVVAEDENKTKFKIYLTAAFDALTRVKDFASDNAEYKAKVIGMCDRFSQMLKGDN